MPIEIIIAAYSPVGLAAGAGVWNLYRIATARRRWMRACNAEFPS